MHVIFLGAAAFAVPSLQNLIAHSYDVDAVFTQPDRPSGRGQKLQPGPIKVFAQSHGIPVFQPERIRNEENRDLFEKFKPDFIVVAAYGQILPGWLLKAARLMPVNVHASLLPRYRGAAPISWAILNGEAIAGVTTMVMEEKLDSGAMLLQKEIPISLTMTAGELTDILSEAGAGLLIQTLDGVLKNAITPINQDESRVSWAPRIAKEMAEVAWAKGALEIHNQIRAMNPWPGAHTMFRGERLHLWRSLPMDSSAGSSKQPGAFLGLSKDGIYVQCGGCEILDVLEVQKPGKNRISGREFANGARLRAGDSLAQDFSKQQIT